MPNVLITGASTGIGLATALELGAAQNIARHDGTRGFFRQLLQMKRPDRLG